MSDDDARPPSRVLRTVRDATLLLVVAAVLVAGLVHYGGRLRSQDDRAHGTERRADVTSPTSPTAAPTASPTASPTSSSSADAWLEDGQPTAPVIASATCWDGRTVGSLSRCTLPTGTAGLKWVFPSLTSSGASCHHEPRPAGPYRTVVGWECFASAGGQPVAITYEQVTSASAAGRAVDREYAGARRFAIPGPHGGRYTWFDASGQPVRVTGVYPRFPYVVSLYAPTAEVAKTAWATLVDQRPPQAIRGLPA